MGSYSGQRSAHPLHRGRDVVEHAPRPVEVPSRDRRARDDHEGVPVARLVVAVGIPLERVRVAAGSNVVAQALLDRAPPDGRRRGVVVQGQAALARDLEVPSRLDLAVELLELALLEEEAEARGEERADVVRTVLRARDLGRAELEQGGDDRVAQPAKGAAVGALEDDQHGLRGRRSPLEPSQLLHAGRVVRQQRVVPRAQRQPRGVEGEEGGDHAHQRQRRERSPELPRDEAIDERARTHHGAPCSRGRQSCR